MWGRGQIRDTGSARGKGNLSRLAVVFSLLPTLKVGNYRRERTLPSSSINTWSQLMRGRSCETARHIHIANTHTTDILTMKKEPVAEQWESLASHPVVCLISTNRMKGMLQVSKVKGLLGIHSSPCIGCGAFQASSFQGVGKGGEPARSYQEDGSEKSRRLGHSAGVA